CQCALAPADEHASWSMRERPDYWLCSVEDWEVRALVKVSNLTLCYEGVQRTYRNAVVGYVRTRMVAVYHSDYGPRLRKPFEKEWEKIKLSSEERRKTGELSIEITDEFDLLGVNHFFNLFDAYHDVLCPYSDGAERDQRAKEKNALLGWMK